MSKIMSTLSTKQKETIKLMRENRALFYNGANYALCSCEDYSFVSIIPVSEAKELMSFGLLQSNFRHLTLTQAGKTILI